MKEEKEKSIINEKLCSYCGEPLKENEVDICDDCRHWIDEKKESIEVYNRQSVFVNLKDYHSIYSKEDSYIEVTKWTNGEGFDIIFEDAISNKINKVSLDWDQATALINCLNRLGMDIKEELL